MNWALARPWTESLEFMLYIKNDYEGFVHKIHDLSEQRQAQVAQGDIG
jgi:hypothetical protein